MDHNSLHRALLRPEAYPEATERITFRETHISRLYITDRHVYKIKKPVDFGFLDFTTLNKRKFYCHEELRLNSRFAPDTYLDVMKIGLREGKPFVGVDGDPIEYTLRMKRLPEERMLARLIDRGDTSLAGEMSRLAHRISELHAESLPTESAEGSDLKNIQRNWRENFTQTAPLGGTLCPQGVITHCGNYVEAFLESASELIRRREASGFVRDVHGDLHAEHVCLTDPVRIFDCIEFNRRFRICDVASDIAFLLMDLDFRGRGDLGRILLREYLGACGTQNGLVQLIPFYKVYRAYVRGKVNAFLAKELGEASSEGNDASRTARQYFALALGYLAPPLFILTCGLMGTGKTTVGNAVAHALGGALIRSDLLRKEIAGIPTERRVESRYGEGIYTPDLTRKTYDLLLTRSMEHLKQRNSVIADASFGRREERERFREAAMSEGIPVILLQMACDRTLTLQRLSVRRESGKDASDGRPELYDEQSRIFEPPTDGEASFRVDTGRNVDYNAVLILCHILDRLGIRP